MRKSPISTTGQNFRFRREERLKGRDEIRAVFNRGKTASCSGAKLFILEQGRPGKSGGPGRPVESGRSGGPGKSGGNPAGFGADSRNRIAFTFARKFGNAAARNRARRVSREAYRLTRNRIKSGFDLVLLIYPGRDYLTARMEQLRVLFAGAGLLMENK
jgi:ribonuclease P protein component